MTTSSREWNRILPEDKSVVQKYFGEIPVKLGGLAKELGIVVKRSSTIPRHVSGKITRLPTGVYEYFWWSVEKPWNKKNKNGPFATENEAIADAKNKIRTKADVVIFKNLWLNSFHGYINVAVNCCEINPTELVEDE